MLRVLGGRSSVNVQKVNCMIGDIGLVAER